MYAPLLAKIAKVDLGKIRDGNPGSSNLWRAAGWRYGVVALALDYFKGTFPLFLFVVTGLLKNPYIISVAALVGIAGHAFSPFLKFRGGKAVATTFGAWSVLTKWEAPTLIGAIFTVFSVYNKFIGKSKTTPEEDALRVLYGFLALFLYVVFKLWEGRYELLILYIGNFAIILYKHRKEYLSLCRKICRGILRRNEV
ncbi:hypothetical protein A4H02_08010 [Fervidobacterium thailandense]|uniref:Uncharacterized protein n=2 Tax=Fervidobacterium thailandense TaxID=1008305 RepID=A0A1E3G257_9BACT|nr:hypothetical protein A4H02_08010 [Fervidobacterium thailandense]